MLDFQAAIEARKQPNCSVKLEPVKEHPFHNYHCFCGICEDFQPKIVKQLLEQKSAHINEKLHRRENAAGNSWALQFVLKRLLLPTHKIIAQGIGILIPEICFYKDGEADCLYMNAQGNEKVGRQLNGSTRERKEAMLVKLKKEKLTNTQIQKIFNQRRRKYRQKVGASSKRKLVRQMSLYGKKEPIPETKDAVIVKYIDGYEELKTENDFINLTLKRKQDPFFKKIDFIKNFIGVTEEDRRIIYIKHEATKCKYEHLFQRSKTLMRVYGTNIMAGERNYISGQDQAQFMEKVKRESADVYAHYTLYKIISFIEYFYDERITLISAKFLLNEAVELYLLHVYQLSREKLVEYSWTQENYLTKVAEEENKLMQKNVKYGETDEKTKKRCGLIQGQMDRQYEQLKHQMGLSHVENNNQQEELNNQFFSMLHPQVTTPISEIFKEKSMTVAKFQYKYLGYKPQKKSVAQAFNSNLVNNLHKMSPPLRMAKGHEIQDAAFPPRRSALSQHSAKRSFSIGNTLSTVNKTMTVF